MPTAEAFPSGSAMQKEIVRVAKMFGWRVAHFRSIKNGITHRWETPVGADGQGFPDLLLVHAGGEGKILFREVKSKYEQLRPDQIKWRDDLLAAGADWAVWRPADWSTVVVPTLTFGKGSVQ